MATAKDDVLSNPDILRLILRHCDASTLARSGRCCELFRNVGAGGWKKHCKKDWPAQAKLPLTDWRAAYSNAARMRKAGGSITYTPLIDPTDLLFAVELTTIVGSRVVLANTYAPAPAPAPAGAMFKWDVSQEQKLMKLAFKWPDQDRLLEMLHNQEWFISVNVFDKARRKMLMLFDRAEIDPIDTLDFVERELMDETLVDYALHFELVELSALCPGDLDSKACVRPVLRPYYAFDVGPTKKMGHFWELTLNFAWVPMMQDMEPEEPELMTNQEVLRMLASLGEWEKAK